MRKHTLALAASTYLVVNPAFAATNSQLEEFQAELRAMKDMYESRISTLESKLEELQKTEKVEVVETYKQAARRSSSNNQFNPAISLILDGKYQHFSSTGSEMSGFGVGEEGERGREGLALDESEITLSANVDDKFYGSLTAAVVREEGEDKVELEEAFMRTQGGVLPYGLNLKAGRAFWTFGYLNEHHTHSDDFADRPLPYRAYLNKAFNDDGLELSWILPTDLYAEVGGGLFRGDDFPSGSASGSDHGSLSAFVRIGGDIGDNQSWRLGGYALSTQADARMTNEDAVIFTGESDLYALDARYTWAPVGNSQNKELILQGEYMWRDETGTYEDTDAATGAVPFSGKSHGWYAQAVYKFHPQWRIGGRVSQMHAPSTPAGLVGSALDASGFNPRSYSTMIDWRNSEFSRIRFQLNQEELTRGGEDTQLILQYSMSVGAHGAHQY